jgi:hypothetical protein
MTLKGAKATFNDIGTMTVEPSDYSGLVTKMAAYTKRGDKIVSLGIDELQAYADTATNAQAELYMKFAEMDRKQLLVAGATAYWRCFARYTDQVGITDNVDWEISQAVVDEYVPYFLSHDEDPAFRRMKMKILRMKLLSFLPERDPMLYALPE